MGYSSRGPVWGSRPGPEPWLASPQAFGAPGPNLALCPIDPCGPCSGRSRAYHLRGCFSSPWSSGGWGSGRRDFTEDEPGSPETCPLPRRTPAWSGVGGPCGRPMGLWG